MNGRVADGEKLRQDLRWLLGSSLALSGESLQLRQVTANLYLQLLWQHLLVRPYTSSELARCLPRWCGEDRFLALRPEEAQLNAGEAELLAWMRAGEYRRILRKIKEKRIKSRIKGNIKEILRLVGLRK